MEALGKSFDTESGKALSFFYTHITKVLPCVTVLCLLYDC